MSRNDRSPRSARASAGLVPNDENASDSSSANARDTRDAVSIYLDRGWHSPLTLAQGRKFPPPDFTTGNYDYPTADDLIAMWGDDDRANLALRMPTVEIDGETYEVLGIDVDQYDNKHGAKTLAVLVAELGELPATYRSTSRGADIASGIRFYLVPAGQKWSGSLKTRVNGQTVSDIEIIARTHRYAVAWPSVVTYDKGRVDPPRVYAWFDADGNPCGVPRVADLPKLPASWVEHLRKGTADETIPILRGLDPEDARAWLAEHIAGYDDTPTPTIAEQVTTTLDAVSSGAHEAIVDPVWRIVALASEGHHGLAAALDAIRDGFFREVLGGNDTDARRGIDQAHNEWNRSLTGAIGRLRGALDAGLRTLSPVGLDADSFDLDLDALAAWLNTSSRHRRPPTMTTTTGAKVELPELVDATDYPNNDTGRAHIFLDTLGASAVALDDVDNEWMIRLGDKWHHMTADQIHADLWGSTVTAALTDAAVRLSALAESDADEKIANAMHSAAQKSGDESVMIRGVRHAHKACANRRSLMDFDADSVTLGADNGIIDVEAYQRSGDPADVLRPATPADLVTESVGFAFDPYAHSQRVDTFLDLFIPEPELRRDVFRVLGSMIVTGNPLRHFVTVIGETSTGKTTLTRYLNASLGAYCAPGSTAMFGGSAGPNPELLDSVRRRVLTMSETNSRVIFHGDTLKMLTGNDTIAARKLYSNKVVKATPRFTPILVTNQMPSITEADDAVFTRLIVIPFTHQHRDKVDEAEFTPADRSHFLRLVIDGYLDGLDNKWIEASDLCAQIADATEAARGALDPFRGWVGDTFIEDVSAPSADHVGAAEAWEAYSIYCKVEEVERSERLTRRTFSRRMVEIFGATTSRGGRRVYKTPIVLRGNTDAG